MATTFSKNQEVKVKGVIPQGPIQAFRMDEDGIVYCLISWVDINGIRQTRWFKEEELETV